MDIPTTGPGPWNELDEAGEQEDAAGLGEGPGVDDVEAFQRLFEAHFDRVYRFVYRYVQSAEDAKDLVHDVFLRVWRQRRQIGLERDLTGYLYTSARNHALDCLKRRRVEGRWRQRRSDEAAAEGEVLVPDPAAELAARERAAAVQRAIDTLPRRQREVLELRWGSHLTYEGVAKALGISPKTVAIHISRALQHLRDRLPDLLE